MSESSPASTAGRLVGSALASGRAAAGATRRAIKKNPTADKAYRTGVGVVDLHRRKLTAGSVDLFAARVAQRGRDAGGVQAADELILHGGLR